MRSVTITTILALLATSVLADGSVALTDVQKVIEQQPALNSLLSTQLDVAKTGWAVRLGNHFVHLGGARVGPYVFQAKPADQPGPYTLELTVCTRVVFLGADGTPSKDEREAKAIREQLRFVIVQDSASTQKADCPE
jgi:hypothetical protein